MLMLIPKLVIPRAEAAAWELGNPGLPVAGNKLGFD